MSATDRKQFGTNPLGEMALPLAVIAAGVIGWGVFGAWWAGYKLAGLPTEDLLGRVISGDAPWVTESTYAAVGVAVILAALAALVIVAVVRTKHRTKRIDRASPYMARDRDLMDLTEKGRAKSAKQKGIDGPPLPCLVKTLGGKWIATGPESTTTFICGPRGGKSSTAAIPRIVEWRGPVVATSNKRDLVDATRRWRERDGDRAWVFDPQGIIREAPTWYWNPISYVIGGGQTGMDVRAARLANKFAFATGTHTKGGDYFNATGEGLVASLILAAALSESRADRTLAFVRRHLNNPSLGRAKEVLERAGYQPAASALRSIQDLASDQRDGVYGTAETMTQFLTYKSVEPWITPAPGRGEFDPHEFVRSNDTLYSISREGQGSMGPLVTALTVAVCEAGEELAQSTPGGRLATPLGLVLDEVANVCRWAALPDVYSHYGSKGIIIISFFQSWSQGANVWGDAGMKALWSASTTRIIGPGIAENGFLESVSHMIGDYVRVSRSKTFAANGGSSSVQGVRDTVLTVADLTAMPFGRAVVVEAGHQPMLVETVPWWDRSYAKELARYTANPPTSHSEPPRPSGDGYRKPKVSVLPPEDEDEYTTARSR